MNALAQPLPAAVLDGPAAALRRLATGPDAEAWAWIAEHEGPQMFRVAARLLGAAAADDVCQEALLHVRAGASRFRPPEDADADEAGRAWLLRITINVATNWRRGEWRRVRHERQSASVPPETRPPVEPDLEAMRLALAELPESQRVPLVLHHLGGQEFTAIGAAIGTTPGTARVRAHRGLTNLRTRLARIGVLVAAG